MTETQADLLDAVIARVGRASRTARVVFDLDGTLIDNRPRSVAILHELAERWARSRGTAAAALRRLEPTSFRYLVEENLERVGIDDSALVSEAVDFWRDRFFVDDYLQYDRPHVGAVDFSKACYEAGATLVYFTGRDHPNMASGSIHSLTILGFPVGVPRVEFLLKPDAETTDAAFKRAALPRLSSGGEVIATFENEPAHCNLFVDAFPDADHFFVDTQHAPGAPVLGPGVHVIDDFAMGRSA